MITIIAQRLLFLVFSIVIGTLIGLGVETNNGKLIAIGITWLSYHSFEILEAINDLRRR